MENETTEIMDKGQSKRLCLASLIVLFLDVAGIAFVLYLSTTVSGKFKEIYKDLFEGEALPALTSKLISVPPLAWLIFFVGVGIFMILKERYVADKTRTLLWNLAVLIMCIVFAVICIIAFYQPLVGWQGGMSA